MSRWLKEDATPNAVYNREWSQTEAGIAYRKRHAEYAREWRKKNKDKFKSTQKRAYDKVRLEVLTHYSNGTPKCACCKEQGIYFLTIDHTVGNGAAHRREIGMAQGDANQVKKENQKVSMGGNGFVYWLKKNNYPEGYQILCANCNFAKRANPTCPHKLN